MCKLDRIECIDKSGKACVFHYRYEFDELDHKHRVNVYANAEFNGPAFEFSYETVCENPRIWKQTGMFHHGASVFSGKGIPDSLIPALTVQFNAVIESSPRNQETSLDEEAVWRTPAADKVWERLVAKNLAEYDTNLNVYRTVQLERLHD